MRTKRAGSDARAARTAASEVALPLREDRGRPPVGRSGTPDVGRVSLRRLICFFRRFHAALPVAERVGVRWTLCGCCQGDEGSPSVSQEVHQEIGRRPAATAGRPKELDVGRAGRGCRHGLIAAFQQSCNRHHLICGHGERIPSGPEIQSIGRLRDHPERMPLLPQIVPRTARRLLHTRQWPERDDAGMSTAEYAVGTLAACGFAGVLWVVVHSSEVHGLLQGVVTRALNLAP